MLEVSPAWKNLINLEGRRMEKTFAIIKPDAFKAGNAGKIIERIYGEGFRIIMSIKENPFLMSLLIL